MFKKLRNQDNKFKLRFILSKSHIKTRHLVSDNYFVKIIKYLILRNTLLFHKGLIRSIKARGPVLKSGKPIPWTTHPFLEYIEKLDLSSMTMAEFGAGHSTIYFKEKVSNLVSYECDSSLIHYLREEYGYSGEIIHVDQRYGGHRADFNKDIIFIDGLDRDELLRVLLACVQAGAIQRPKLVIIDNPNFVDQELLSELGRNGYIRVDFYGMVSDLFDESITSLFVARDVEDYIFDSISTYSYHTFFEP
jgi:hypothetical protein